MDVLGLGLGLLPWKPGIDLTSISDVTTLEIIVKVIRDILPVRQVHYGST